MVHWNVENHFQTEDDFFILSFDFCQTPDLGLDFGLTLFHPCHKKKNNNMNPTLIYLKGEN